MARSVEELEARVRAATALRRLNHGIIAHDIDIEVLERIADAANQLADDVEAHDDRTRPQRSIDTWSMPDPGGEANRSTHLFADSIVSGSANPMGINASIGRRDGEAVLKVTLGPAHEGAPGRAHGGMVAAIIDETMGLCLGIIKTPAFTGRLTITYRNPTPLGVELTGSARVVEQQGRKILMTAEIKAGDQLIAEGDALFIAVDRSKFVGQES
jgi:acyl-coenzyme A thioesterase PaaI-like protein